MNVKQVIECTLSQEDILDAITEYIRKRSNVGSNDTITINLSHREESSGFGFGEYTTSVYYATGKIEKEESK